MKREAGLNTAPDAASERVVSRLGALLKGRAREYEIFLSFDSGLSVEAKGGHVDALKVRSNSGVGLRTVAGNRQGFSFTTVLADAALTGLVDTCLASGAEATPDECVEYIGGSMAPSTDPAAMGIFDPAFQSISTEDKIKKALLIEEAAMSQDVRIRRVRKASYGETLKCTRVVNSNGVDRSYRATFYTASVTAVGEEDGDSQTGFEVSTGHGFSSIDPEAVGAGAAKNALRMLGAKKTRTVRCPAVFENSVVCEFIETLAGSFLADSVIKGKSMLAGRLGKNMASGAVTIYDDGIMKGGWASSIYDGEGAPRQTTTLVERGVCKNYLYDSYWARRAGAASTGNAVRTNFKSLPSVGVSNIYLAKGTKTLDEMISTAGSGLFITELMGVHTVNTVNGDFSLGAAGLLIEGGSLSHPVRGLAISGNLLKLFERIDECGADLRFYGSIGAPSVLVGEVEASGE